jgi:hypothetical protein
LEEPAAAAAGGREAGFPELNVSPSGRRCRTVAVRRPRRLEPRARFGARAALGGGGGVAVASLADRRLEVSMLRVKGFEWESWTGMLMLACLAVAPLLAVWPRPAAAYLDVAPPTLGVLCASSQDICVLQVEKFSVEKGVIVFKVVEVLKGKSEATSKHSIGKSRFFTQPRYANEPKARGQKVVRALDDNTKIIMDWATKGKTAVLFDIRSPARGAPLSYGHVYIDNYWYRVWHEKGFWHLFVGNPGADTTLLTRYCGSPAKLKDAVSDILRNKEVVVPCMVHGNKEDLRRRTAKIQRLRASLHLKDYNPKRDFVGWGAEEK